MMRTFAVVVHYRGLEDTRACLAALERAAGAPGGGTLEAGERGEGGASLETILVDNSPCGEGAALARREFPRVRALEPGANTGFAGGSNLGIRAALDAGADAVVLVNSDAVVAPDFLAPLLEAARAPGAGLATGKILLPDRPGEPRRIWAAGSAYHALRGLGLNRGEGEPDGPRFAAAGEVDYASGCLLLALRAVFVKVGLLDERFFLYLEDTEFCHRARRAGFATRYEPRSVAVHRVHGASAGTPEVEGPATVYYLTRNRVVYARERLSPAGRAAFLAFFLASRAAKVAAEVARGRADRARLILRAVRDGLRGRTGAAPAGVLS
jgi:hypothetical protein